MPKKLTAIKNWDEIPDMMSPQDYADVMGCSIKTSYERFNRKDFPKVTNGKANKNEVMKYLGIKNDIENSTTQSLLLELIREVRELKQSQLEKTELLKKVI